jgi:cytochrome P450
LSNAGIPHKCLKEDVYRDMYIPKGTIVIANAWAMGHDSTVYKDSYKFDPDPYIPAAEGGAGEPVPVAYFGFGRREELATNPTLLSFVNI